MDLSIVIINFRTFTLTVNCIDSIEKNLSGLKYEIILVDNAPKEDLAEEFKKRFQRLIYIQSKENLGFGRANNLGIQQAKGKYLLLINSDTLVLDDSLQRCYSFMESEQAKEIGLLGCKLLNEDGSFQPSFFPFTRNSLTTFLLGNNLLLYRLFKVSKKYLPTEQVQEVGDVSGAFMFMRKEVVDKVGPFDPDFFMYCEETEWCRERIAKHYKIVYFPKAAIVHYGGKSAPKSLMYVQSKLSQSLLWYKKGWLNYILYIILSYGNLLINTLLLPFVGKDAKQAIKKDWKCYARLFPYLFKEIPKYGCCWGSRAKPLFYHQARQTFFGG